MNDRKKPNGLLGLGLAGAGLLAVCCFTPALVLLFAALGISSLMGAWLDFILLPGLVFFLGLTGYALIRRNQSAQRAKSTAADSRS
jgi:mercuric ion transport protein